MKLNNIMTLKPTSEVTQSHWNWYGSTWKLRYGFLFAFRSNYGSILYHFRHKV